jgi:hypothetical protein
VTDLRDHLVASRLAGAVATSPGNTLRNCARLVAGHETYTFGLDDWRAASLADAIAAVRAVCGGDPEQAEEDGPGFIDPDRTLAAIERHRDRLADFAAAGGGRVLLATGHPTGLLPHYAAIGRLLAASGSTLLAPLDDVLLQRGREPRGIRFLDGVAAVTDGANLRHTHLPMFMEAMLDELAAPPELVLADHGMAGAAIARGIPTLSIADVNDPALPLAQYAGRTDAVLPIDDNLAPTLFQAVTAEITRRVPVPR